MARTEIRLAGSVDIRTLLPILAETDNEARRSRGGLRLKSDCFAVDDSTSLSLAQLVKSRRALREHGADLILLGGSERLRSCVVHPLFVGLCG